MNLTLLNGITIEQTTTTMSELVERHKTDVTIRQYVADIVREKNLEQGDVPSLCDAVYEWVRKRVKYWADIHDVETIQSPHVTLELGIGDCDDLSVLAATLLQAAGVPTQWLLLGYTGDYPEHICVYCPAHPAMTVDCSVSPSELPSILSGATFSAIL